MLQLKRITDFDSLPDSALLDVKEIRYLAGRSPASIWRDVKRGRLPRPIAIGPNASRWRAADVRAYMGGVASTCPADVTQSGEEGAL